MRRALAHTDTVTGISVNRDPGASCGGTTTGPGPDPVTRPDGAAHPVDLMDCGRCGRYSTVAARRRPLIVAAVLGIPLAWLFTPAGFAAFLSMASPSASRSSWVT